MVEVTKGKRMPVERASSFCCIVKTMQIFSAISGIINEKVITLITFSIPTKMSKLMKAFLQVFACSFPLSFPVSRKERISNPFRRMSLQH